MVKNVFRLLSLLVAFSASAAEMTFDFNQFAPNSFPTGFVSKISGTGSEGEWKIIEDEIPSAFAPLSPNAPKIGKRHVLAQLSQDKTDEHFPMLIFAGETFGDFTLTTSFKCVSGVAEQMAGVAFRVQDEKNYYVVRGSALGNSFRFYKVVNGERSVPIGQQVTIPTGVWHELSITCKGNQIHCSLDGKEWIPSLTDNSFAAGKIAFWTKSDSVSYFANTKITYTPRIPMAQKVVTEMMKRYPRVIGLKIFAPNEAKEIRAIASNEPSQIGEPGATAEENVLAKSTTYFAKSKDTVSIIMPLKDRNGETMAALRVILKPFAGQTEKNAFARALPIAKAIEARVMSAKDLTQ